MLSASLILLLCAGACAGILAGLLGIGGGIVLVPVLLWWLSSQAVDANVVNHIAIATALATMLGTAPASAFAHYRHGAVDLARIRRWALPVMLGAGIGAVLARWIPGDWLRSLFAVLALTVGFGMSLGRKPVWQLANHRDGPALASGIGLLSSWLGIGGGSFFVPALTQFGIPLRTAIGTSSGLGLAIALPATVGYIAAGWPVEGRPHGTLGFVHVVAALVLASSAAALAPIGAKIAHHAPVTWLRRLFGVFLLIVGIRLLVGIFRG
ncbi:MAG: sulfite exporter TauE/SafE family protein [Pseudomonadota bacterium]